jgi:hypothetical protein
VTSTNSGFDPAKTLGYEGGAMRGFLQPALKTVPTDNQVAFSKMSRGRRVELAEAAQTNLVKASQWARGEAVSAAIAEALDKGTSALVAKKK